MKHKLPVLPAGQQSQELLAIALWTLRLLAAGRASMHLAQPQWLRVLQQACRANVHLALQQSVRCCLQVQRPGRVCMMAALKGVLMYRLLKAWDLCSTAHLPSVLRAQMCKPCLREGSRAS